MLNFPNQLSGGLKSMFTTIGPEQLKAVLAEVGRNLRPVLRRVAGSAPFLEVLQRHYLATETYFESRWSQGQLWHAWISAGWLIIDQQRAERQNFLRFST